MREIPFTILRGFVMGAADIVPGVSGGTVALVFAIYDRLITAVKTGSSALGRFLKLDFKGGVELLKEVEWGFLLPLLAGIGIALLALSSIIENALHDHPVEMAGLFLGLVLGSVIVAWQLLERYDATALLVLVAVAALTFFLLGLREGTTEESVAGVSNPSLLAFFGAGALAICAMILPGISGSFILVMIGMYSSVLAAVSDRDIVSIAAVGLGCVVGLALFSQLLHWALNVHYNPVMAALIGLMLGSIRVLWPWPLGVDSTALEAPSDPVVFPIGLTIFGMVLVVAVNEIAKRLDRRDTGDERDEVQSV